MFVYLGAAEVEAMAVADQHIKLLKAQLWTKFKYVHRIWRRTHGNFSDFFTQLLTSIEPGTSRAASGKGAKAAGAACTTQSQQQQLEQVPETLLLLLRAMLPAHAVARQAQRMVPADSTTPAAMITKMICMICRHSLLPFQLQRRGTKAKQLVLQPKAQPSTPAQQPTPAGKHAREQRMLTTQCSYRASQLLQRNSVQQQHSLHKASRGWLQLPAPALQHTVLLLLLQGMQVS